MNAREGVEVIVDGAFPDREARRRVDLLQAVAREDERTAILRIVSDWYRSSEGRDVLIEDLEHAGFALPDDDGGTS